MHVYSWGYMGCGKSTIGKKIATMQNCDFIDTDKLIEANENKTIDAIFETMAKNISVASNTLQLLK